MKMKLIVWNWKCKLFFEFFKKILLYLYLHFTYDGALCYPKSPLQTNDNDIEGNHYFEVLTGLMNNSVFVNLYIADGEMKVIN